MFVREFIGSLLKSQSVSSPVENNNQLLVGGLSLSVKSSLRNYIQKATGAVVRTKNAIQDKVNFGKAAGLLFEHNSDLASEAIITAREIEIERAKNLKVQLSAWRDYPDWTDHPPDLKVSSTAGSFCDLDCTFTIGLPPDAVYDILCDPDNHRVFKNIKEMKTRNVIEDTGIFQRALVEQTAIWHFLWLSGTFDVLMEVCTDKALRKIDYRLAKGGFMKRFEGQWSIKPLPLPRVAPNGKQFDDENIQLANNLTEKKKALTPKRIASLVTLRQQLQPAVRLPPPISSYVRGISASATRSMLADLQLEAQRVRCGIPLTDALVQDAKRAHPPPLLDDKSQDQERSDHTKKGHMSSRRKGNRFRQKMREGF